MNEPLDLAGLRAAQHTLAAPFDLTLTAVESGPLTLRCEEIFRLLPARRLVARVHWQGGPAVLKLFFDKLAQRYIERELAGLAKLMQAGIASPAILGQVNLLGGARGLLFNYLPGATAIHWRDTESIETTAHMLADLHARGIWQDDLHLDNFLKCSDGVFAIDGDGVRSQRSPLSEKRSFANLGVLLAQRPPGEDDSIDRIGRVYCARRGWSSPGERLSRLRAALVAQRRNRVRRYLAKVQRDCTSFSVARNFGEYRVCIRERLPDLGNLLEAPETSMAVGTSLKTGNSATVVRVAISPSESVVMKRYNVKNVLHGLRRALKPRARFRLAWINGQRLQFLNIPTARPLALIEKRAGPWRGVAYLLAEDLGDLDLLAEVRRRGLSARRCAQVTEIFVNLRRVGLTHGDTKASNFLVYDDRLFLIDLDAMVEGTQGQKKDLERFLQNWEAPERQRFEEAFQQAGLV